MSTRNVSFNVTVYEDLEFGLEPHMRYFVKVGADVVGYVIKIPPMLDGVRYWVAVPEGTNILAAYSDLHIRRAAAVFALLNQSSTGL